MRNKNKNDITEQIEFLKNLNYHLLINSIDSMINLIIKLFNLI